MHHPTDRIAHTTAFVTLVVEHWLEREIAQWVDPTKDRSDAPSHHERTLSPRSYISFRVLQGYDEHVVVERLEHAAVEFAAAAILDDAQTRASGDVPQTGRAVVRHGQDHVVRQRPHEVYNQKETNKSKSNTRKFFHYNIFIQFRII